MTRRGGRIAPFNLRRRGRRKPTKPCGTGPSLQLLKLSVRARLMLTPNVQSFRWKRTETTFVGENFSERSSSSSSSFIGSSLLVCSLEGAHQVIEVDNYRVSPDHAVGTTPAPLTTREEQIEFRVKQAVHQSLDSNSRLSPVTHQLESNEATS